MSALLDVASCCLEAAIGRDDASDLAVLRDEECWYLDEQGSVTGRAIGDRPVKSMGIFFWKRFRYSSGRKVGEAGPGSVARTRRVR